MNTVQLRTLDSGWRTASTEPIHTYDSISRRIWKSSEKSFSIFFLAASKRKEKKKGGEKHWTHEQAGLARRNNQNKTRTENRKPTHQNPKRNLPYHHRTTTKVFHLCSSASLNPISLKEDLFKSKID